MNPRRSRIKPGILAFACFFGSMLADADYSSSGQEGFIPPPEKGQSGVRTERVSTPLCQYYIKEEHWDGLGAPKIIAYFESDEMKEMNSPSYFALRNEDGFTYTLFPIDGTRCARCHQGMKTKEYIFLKPNQKPA